MKIGDNMLLADALSKSKIAMLRLKDKTVFVTNTAAYEASSVEAPGELGATILKEFKVIKNFNNIPDSKEWEALGYREK